MFGVFKKRVCHETHGGCWDKYYVQAKNDSRLTYSGKEYFYRSDDQLLAEFPAFEEAKAFANKQPENFSPMNEGIYG